MNVHHLIPTRRKSSPTEDSYHPLKTLQQDIDLMFDNFFNGFSSQSNNASQTGLISPRMDVSETEDAYHLTLDLPGVAEEDVDISISGETLVIRAKKHHETKEDNAHYHFVERSSGEYVRKLNLPSEINLEDISASYKDGVLMVELPKRPEEKPTTRKITLKSAK